MDLRQNDQTIVEKAASWAVRLEAGDLSAEENIALSQWLRESPRHVEELLLTSTLLAASGGLDPERRIDVQSLIDRSSTSVVDFADGAAKLSLDEAGEPQARVRMRKTRYTWMAAAGVMIAIAIAYLVAATGVFTLSDGASQTYATQLGEQRSLTLPDGSVVHINTQSQVNVSYSAALRTITLLSGEAMFEVASDPQRPFRVLAGETVVQAVGTEFNVYRQAHRTNITVIEGKVAVLPESELAALSIDEAASLSDARAAQPSTDSLLPARNPVLLTVGQEALVSQNGTVEKISTVDPALRTSWLRRMLVFRNEPLSHVVQEFNRYNGLQIRIDDPELARTPLTVALRADNPQALLELLATSENIVIERKGATEIIVRRDSTPEVI